MQSLLWKKTVYTLKEEGANMYQQEVGEGVGVDLKSAQLGWVCRRPSGGAIIGIRGLSCDSAFSI